MKNNDKNFDEILTEKPTKKLNIPKVNFNTKKEYKNIFLCPLNKHDVVNSMDILGDTIIYGTIMGNVYLCRVDKNNLKPEINKRNNTDSNTNDKNKEIKAKNNNDNSSKISCIKLDVNSNSNNKSNSNIRSNTNNSLYQINQNEIKTNKNKNFYDSDIIPTTRSVYNKFKNPDFNMKKIFLNKIIHENKNSQSDKSILKRNSLISLHSHDTKHTNNKLNSLPQVVQLVTNASENIACLSFDTKDKINVAIGDSDIIRLENLSNVNFDEENENYYYTQIKNYTSENEHIKNCEGAICLMSDNNFLLIKASLTEYGTPLIYDRYTYLNKTITTYEITKGEIETYNFFVPFDFDGDRFLYLEFAPENMRSICIYYTLMKLGPKKFQVDKSFGHVSFMKFISLNKIIICRKNKICEIWDIFDDFKLVESWEHIGEEIIAMNVYIKGKKEEEDDKMENSMTESSYKKLKEKHNIMDYMDTNYKKSKKTKNKAKLGYSEDIYGLNPKLNLKKFPMEKDKANNSTYRELIGINFRKQFNSNEEKDNEIAIYNQKKVPSGKENITNEANNKINLDILTNNNEYNYIQSNKAFVEKKKKISYLIQNNADVTDKSIDDGIYIITVDKNGNFNKYHNGKVKTIFNLYDIKNIEQNYKDDEFFSLGFPYFVVMNNKYYAISTDHGVFVLSKKA